MEAIRTVFEKIPEIINIPKNFVNKSGEIIILADEDTSFHRNKTLGDFFGILPDFPERTSQGDKDWHL